ncbi:two-component system, OmpR family, phosphate regulon sensor histidine kinase PhoR [Filimonas lacunae]|uniref:histidine kinase n=1 Tax=Filimonas lacunae TaxID=477680 RepID=A0A173MQ93_9BACT|nr:HAMP domain-containing sensor histidine kinase [Filimonas lacunae]BAV09619.1 two-component sensor histidine kinase [Filimonas lacunae]SIS76019.1 two-component system, OmpR family, phosphate regulon sensor histidine kinase PhoR [Filimonas lacunae]
MNRLHLSRVLMAGTIILIAAFQCYWLVKVYKEEYNTLQRKTDILLKDAIQQIQAERMKGLPASLRPENIEKIEIVSDDKNNVHSNNKAIITTRSSAGADINKGGGFKHDSVKVLHWSKRMGNGSDSMMDFPPPPPFFNIAIAKVVDSLQNKAKGKDTQNVRSFILELNKLDDSIPIAKLDSHYTRILQKENIYLAFQLKTASLPNRRAAMDSVPKSDKLTTRFAMQGFNASIGYYAVFENPFSYISKKLLIPFCVSIMLIGFTIISFVFVYRNMLAQQRLADMKNEFISNITHELKTPVATVNVAIEALRNFNALEDTVRTKEYLDISAIELQRLSLLIDKVLRLSMFENHNVSLRLESVDIVTLTQEVLTSMRLQLEKAKATVHFNPEQSILPMQADRLHFTSVIYNLLDNAIKYSPANPVIDIQLLTDNQSTVFTVKDNGIGIPAAYKHKLFEKFFRVPDNDRHNTRGYGLGLSYVAHIIRLHKGTIEVNSEEGKGSTFIIKLPLVHE